MAELGKCRVVIRCLLQGKDYGNHGTPVVCSASGVLKEALHIRMKHKKLRRV